MTTLEKTTKERDTKSKQTRVKATKKGKKKPAKKPSRHVKAQRGAKTAKRAKLNPATSHTTSPALMTPEDDTRIQGLKRKGGNDASVTSFFGTCQDGLSLTRCTEASTGKEFLCVTSLNKQSHDCTVRYIRPLHARQQTSTPNFYSSVLEESAGEVGLHVDSLDVPLLVDELPANASLIDLHDIQGVTFNGKPVPDGTTYLRLVNVNLKGYPSRDFSNITLPSSVRRINLMRNKITTFDPSDWKDSNVDNLSVSHNLIGSLGRVQFPSKLTVLNARSNNLTDASFDGAVFPSTLSSLRLGKNRIQRIDSVPMANLAQLEHLDLAENKAIKTLDGDAAKALPPSLVHLDLSECCVTTITRDFALPPSLQILTLSRNNLTTFPMALTLSPKLTHVYLNDNPVMDFKVTSDEFKRLQALAHFSADTQNLECDPGTVKTVVANATYVCVVTSSTSVLQKPNGSTPSSNFGTVQLVLVIAGAIVGVLGIALAVYLLLRRRRRLVQPPVDDPDDKSTPSSSQPYHVRTLGPLGLLPEASNRQLTSTFGGYTTEVAATTKSFGGYTTVVASTDKSFAGYSTEAGATNKSFDGYTTQVAPTVVSFPGDTAIMASGRVSDVSTKSSVSSSASCSGIDSHLVHTPTWLAGMSELTKLVIPYKLITDVHPFHSMHAGTWNNRPVVLQPFHSTDPAASLKLLTALSHPNIVSLYGITWSDDMVVSRVVEQCPRNLQALLSNGEPMSLATKLNIAADVATALLFLHSMHVVHDRLSDTQVLIMANGSAKVNFPRVSGPSRWSTASETQRGGENEDYDVWAEEAAHRLVWTAPERLSNDDELSNDEEAQCKADVYALGILISTLQRQSLPGDAQQRSDHAVGVVAERLRGDSRSSRRTSVVEYCPDVEWFTPECPVPLRNLITKCLHVFPHDRPTAMDVACQLREMARAASTK